MLRPLFTLGSRLEAVGELAAGASRLIDVGSDHARLPVWLLMHGKLSWACAADISPFSVEKAQRMAARFHLEGQLDTRLSDGLSAFSPDEADTIVLAGMGGETIAAILSACPWITQGEHRIIIQCMSSLDRLDNYLVSAGFTVEAEQIVRDAGRLYSVARLKAGKDGCADSILPSEHLLSSPLAAEYLDRLIRLERRKLTGAKASKTRDSLLLSSCEARISRYLQLKEALV